MSVLDYFIGTAQSKYAAMAIFAAIIVLCIAILFTNTEITLANRVAVIFFIVVMAIFPVAISLFELTCIVSGGKKGGWTPCNVFGWFVAIMIVVYCFILIIMTLMSMFSYKKALDKVSVSEHVSKISKEDSEIIAQNIIKEHYTDKKEENKLEEAFQVPFKESFEESLQKMKPLNLEGFQERSENNKPITEHLQDQYIQKNNNELDGYDSENTYMDLNEENLQQAQNVKSLQMAPQVSAQPSGVKKSFNDVGPEPFTNTLEKFSPI